MHHYGKTENLLMKSSLPKYFKLILGDKTNFPIHLAAFSSSSDLG